MKYKLYILIAFIIGVIFILPHLIMLFLADNYTPFSVYNISWLTLEESGSYATSIRQVLNGHIPPTTATYENKKEWYPLPALPPLILAPLAATFGLKVGWIIADFLFPLLAFLIIYKLLFLMTKKNMLSIFGSCFVVILHNFFRIFGLLQPVYWFKFLTNYSGGIRPLELSRTVSPQITFPILMLSIYFIYRSLVYKKKRDIIISGILAGLNFYAFFYYWTFLFTGLFVLALIFFIRKERDLMKRTLLTATIGFLVGMPSVISLVRIYFSERSKELALPFLVEKTHLPEPITIVYVILLILLFLFYKKKDMPFYFLTSFLISGTILINAQVLLGRTFQNDHWIGRAMEPLLIIIMVLIINYCMNIRNFIKFKKLINRILFILILLILGWGIFTQAKFAITNYENFQLTDQDKELFKWLNENTNTDDVVLTTDFRYNILMSDYTRNSFYMPYSGYSFRPNEEMLERFYIAHRLFEINPDVVVDMFSLENKMKFVQSENGKLIKDGFVYFYLFIDSFSRVERKGLFKYIDSSFVLNISDVKKEYLNYQINNETLKKYRIDYILETEFDRKNGNRSIKEHPFVKEVTSIDNIKIYKFNN